MTALCKWHVGKVEAFFLKKNLQYCQGRFLNWKTIHETDAADSHLTSKTSKSFLFRSKLPQALRHRSSQKYVLGLDKKKENLDGIQFARTWIWRFSLLLWTIFIVSRILFVEHIGCSFFIFWILTAFFRSNKWLLRHVFFLKSETKKCLKNCDQLSTVQK